MFEETGIDNDSTRRIMLEIESEGYDNFTYKELKKKKADREEEIKGQNGKLVHPFFTLLERLCTQRLDARQTEGHLPRF